MELTDMLKEMVEKKVSDIFIVAGRPMCCKLGTKIINVSDEVLYPPSTAQLINEIYALAGRSQDALVERGDDDFTFAIKGVSRFRANVYKQRGSFAAVIRVVAFNLPRPSDFNIPDAVLDIADIKRGLVLFTGPAGSGKTTTLTCIIDRINETRQEHIITLEDPIEYLHPHKRSIISQREISLDTQNYAVALRAALRQSPDVILIGELRGEESIGITLTTAETGHLVFAALHTLGAVNAVDRLVDTFPAAQQVQVRMQLSMVLQSVVCQQLIPTADGNAMVPAFEIMHCNGAVRAMIRDGRTHQIASVIQSSAAEGMLSMDASILELYRRGIIAEQDAITHCMSPEFMKKQMGTISRAKD